MNRELRVEKVSEDGLTRETFTFSCTEVPQEFLRELRFVAYKEDSRPSRRHSKWESRRCTYSAWGRIGISEVRLPPGVIADAERMMSVTAVFIPSPSEPTP